MDYELKNKLVKIISKNILTPVIYMIENDNCLLYTSDAADEL